MASSSRNQIAPQQKVYKKPILTKYGQLKDLTTGGSGNAQESSQGQKPKP